MHKNLAGGTLFDVGPADGAVRLLLLPLVDTEVAQRVAELAQSVVKASIMLRDNKQ